MPFCTTTQSCYQLDLVLNALLHYHTVPLSAGLGIECPLALPHSPVISWTWYWMPSGTTTQFRHQLDLVLNALWHYHTVPSSAGLGIECPLALPHSPVISWTWYWMPSGTTTQSRHQLDLVLNALWHYHTVPLSARLGIECPLALPHSPIISWTWYWMPSGTSIQFHYQLGLVLNALRYYHTVLLSAGLGIECPLALPHSPVIAWLGIECPLHGTTTQSS